MEANRRADSQDSLERWSAAEHRLMERCRKLGWWEAARMAAGYEHDLPPVSAHGLRAWTVQTASLGDKQDYLEVAHSRLRKAIRRDLWSLDNGPPDALDSETVEEVVVSVLDMACNALTATVLADEIERGVISDRRRAQLSSAVERVLDSGDA